MQQNNTNPLTEISLLVISALLIIAGAILFYLTRIDFTGLMVIFGIVATLWGANSLYKAPSPGQQTQIAQQQQSLQQVISQFVGIIPGLVQVFQQQAQTPVQPQPIIIQPPVEALQPQQRASTPTPAPQPVIPQRPQFVPNPVSVLPAINLGAMNDVPTSANMTTLTATPDLTMQPDQRNWNDSALMQAVQPQT